MADLERVSSDTEKQHTSKDRDVVNNAALERRVVRKIDLNLLPLVFGLFLLAFLDRSNVGNARTAGMATDLKFDQDGQGPHTYDWLLTAFYISYIIFEVGILGWKLFPPHIWCSFLALAWGVIATCQGAATSWGGIVALRFLLGVVEAPYGSGVVYFLSFFYLRKEIGFRQGIFFSSAPLATCFAGALAYGITHEKGDIAPWRLLFLVEGIPTVLLVPVVWFFLPDSPSTARFLDEEEKKVAASRAIRQAGKTDRVGSISLKDALATLLDIKPWITALMYFSCNVAYGSLPVYLPTLLQESLGFSAINAQGLTAPPYFFSFLMTLFTPWLADKTQQRGIHVVVLSCVGGIGYILLATVDNVWVRYFGVFLAAGGVFPAIANILPWVTNNQGSDTKRGVGVVLLNLIGQCGPLLGTRIYPTTDAPDYIKGNAICAGFMFFNALLAITLRTILSLENRKLDKQYGTIADQKKQAESDGQVIVASENSGPAFRYVL